MTKRTRNIIFIVLALLFLFVAPLTVMYCLGWRYDWNSKKVIQPGMFYFRVLPKNAEVYLDKNFKKKTDMFFGSLLLEDILPGKYTIEIKKEEYYSWKKVLPIEKRTVTEAKNIVLIPKNPGSYQISGGIESFFLAPDSKNIILKEKDKNQWSLKLFNIAKNLKSHIVSQTNFIKGTDVELMDLKFSPDSERAIIKIMAKEKVSYFILDIKTATIIPLSLSEEDLEEIIFHPKDNNKLLLLLAAQNGKELKELDITSKIISAPIIDKIYSLALLGEDVYYLDNLGFLYKTNLSFSNKNKLNIIPFKIKEETKYVISLAKDNILLQENEDLYILNKQIMSFVKLLSPIKGYKLSPDSQKLMYFNGNEIWIMFLEKKYEQPAKEAGDKVLITHSSEEIGNAFWYDNNYLIFDSGDKIKVSEIDDRDQINIVDLFEFKSPQILWLDNKLYILSNQIFYLAENLN
jgi:hypothetical protein